jgi:hypothetical protein
LLDDLSEWIQVRGIVEAPANLPTSGMADGDMIAVRESAGPGSPPALYIYNSDATAWVNLLSTGLPANHASTHQHGGADEVATAAAAANVIPKTGAGGTLDIGFIPLGATANDVCVGNDARLSDARTPLGHRVSHLNGGADELSAAPTVPGAYPYVVLPTDVAIDATAGAGPTPVNLPTAVGIAGHEVEVKMVATGGGTIDVTPQPGEQIDQHAPGLAFVMPMLDQSVIFRSDGVQWRTKSAYSFPAFHAGDHMHGGPDEVATATPGPNAIVKAGALPQGEIDTWGCAPTGAVGVVWAAVAPTNLRAAIDRIAAHLAVVGAAPIP